MRSFCSVQDKFIDRYERLPDQTLDPPDEQEEDELNQMSAADRRKYIEMAC